MGKRTSKGIPHQLTRLEIGLIKSAYREGQTIRQIAAALHRWPNSIAKVVKAAGLSRPTGKIPKPRTPKIDKKSIAYKARMQRLSLIESRKEQVNG